MKYIISLICISYWIAESNQTPLPQNEEKPFGFSDVIGSGQFSSSGFNGTWISDTKILYIFNNNYVTFDVETEDITHFLSIADVPRPDNTQQTRIFSPDYTKILVRYDRESIYRHSIIAKYFIYDIETNSTIANVADSTPVSICVWSPTSNAIAYVLDNDIYYLSLLDIENPVRLTFDGIPHVIFNGIPDWVYEEEVFGSGSALWFSPDGGKIAYASFNDTNVEIFPYILYGRPGYIEDQYEQLINLRYPKPGTFNPDVALHVVDITQSELTYVTIPVAEDIIGEYILGDVSWANTNDTVGVHWLNRRQNRKTFIMCNLSNGDPNCVYRTGDYQPNGWVEAAAPVCTTWPVCRYRGYQYLTQTSIKEFNVQNFYALGQPTIYFVGTDTTMPETRHLYNGNEECLTCDIVSPEGERCTYASASFSTDFTYYSVTCSGPSPSFTRLYRTSDNTEIYSWTENIQLRETLTGFQKTQILFERVDVEGGFQASVKLILPPDLDINTTTEKYPMIVYVYGGPDSVRVTSSFSIGFPEYLITTHKLIYLQIDGRGSGNKGLDMLFTINNNMGTVEIEDQIAVTRTLQQKYSFIDAERTGIWGWSYGGYATAMVMATDLDRVFQCGIAVAPVTAWIYYDSIYTERFMGLPTETDNLAGYNVSDVTRLMDGFRIHDFLLVHGNADDNVHFQQSMALSKQLQQNDIMFEQMSYPDEAHGLSSVSNHLYHMMDQFWIDCLNLQIEDDAQQT